MKVDVTAPEALAIAEWLLRSFDAAVLAKIREDIARAAEVSRGLDTHERHVRQIPCHFLDSESNACSIYAIRPMRCRGHTSLDASACERACKDPSSGNVVPIDALTQQISAVFTIGQVQALKDLECDAESYELVNAVHVALSEPDASIRWRKGEDVFRAARIPSDEADRAAATEDLLRSVVTPADFAGGEPNTDGVPSMTRPARVGRNERCPCGSGKKWKRCCGTTR